MPRHTAPDFQPYVIALLDPHDPSGSTVLYGDDPEIWDWLFEPVPFTPTDEFREVPIPGTTLTAHVTRWAPINDKAQHLARLPGRHAPHPRLIELELGSTDSLDFHAAYSRLIRAIPVGRSFEGDW